MHFRLDLNNNDNPFLIGQIMAAVGQVKRPIVLSLEDFDLQTIIFADGDRVDGPKVETFGESLIKDLVEATYEFGNRVDPHLYDLTQDLMECQAVYIVVRGEHMTIRGSSYERAFDEVWHEHRELIEAWPKAQEMLERFDETGTTIKPYTHTST